ncbi:hypothetical protein F383_22951 [Gossypium arboreum]|uniref:Uncharacterized protein n=2 Tax=Gossypium arboreum TaxID=29729 RepID=A0ABR0PXE5_GOSAR|nr:uncharacterized protein LOC108452961 [Gossypium arboreum]KAK5831584.1 hypothetical protein PVK06_015382 [Gossypium arboreum]KHG01115.1 hypothetical protein F383_22951 [Gossypium arboreum]
MSKMRYDRKPPLAKSPIRVRPRRVLRSNSTSLQTPPGSLTKSQKPVRAWTGEESVIRPEYRSISCELQALATMVKREVGNGEKENAGFGETSVGAKSTSLFERGRFYEEYSARRNERLKRRKGETGTESKSGHHHGLGVTIESSKKRESKKLESLRKSVSAAYSMERNESQTPRYLLRSMSKANENKYKKPPLAVNNYNSSMSVTGTASKTTTRRVGTRV